MLPKNRYFCCQKDEWDTKEDMKNTLYVNTTLCQKVPFRLKPHQTVKKIKPIELAIIELHFSEGIRQPGSQSVSK